MNNPRPWTSFARVDTRKEADAHRKSLGKAYETKVIEHDGKFVVVFRDRNRR